MSDTITGSVSGAITFELITGYSAEAQDRTIVHPILGSSGSDIVERPAGLRSGRMELLIEGRAAAFAAFTAFGTPQTFTLLADMSELSMDFKRTGGAPEIELEDETRAMWLVRFPWMEIAS